MNYYRLTDGLNKVGKLIPENENPYKFIDDQDKDWYLSIYKYNEEQKKQAEEIIDAQKNGKKFKRARGVSGIDDVTTNKLVFDIDDEKDLALAQRNTVKVIDRLIESGINPKDLNISFSGNKGFSIVVNHNVEMTPNEHRTIAEYFAGDLNSNLENIKKKKFDTSIYNPSRIFRLDFTKHSTSNLYKTPLTINQVKKLSTGMIRKICEEKKKPLFQLKTIEHLKKEGELFYLHSSGISTSKLRSISVVSITLKRGISWDRNRGIEN